ncbi:MAG: hypothetical protein ABSA43_01750 [Candidatus Microgenomates bacterium]|jgi:hypothetical protein
MKLKTPRFLIIIILTAITSIFWIFFGVYRIFTAKPSPPIAPEILETVTPTLDKNAVAAIAGRLYIEEGSVATPTASPSANEQ